MPIVIIVRKETMSPAKKIGLDLVELLDYFFKHLIFIAAGMKQGQGCALTRDDITEMA